MNSLDKGDEEVPIAEVADIGIPGNYSRIRLECGGTIAYNSAVKRHLVGEEISENRLMERATEKRLPMPSMTAIRPDSAFRTAVTARSEQPISLCYQCRKCTNGCPLTFAMDITPNQVMRMIELGLKDEVLRSKTIWVCASCQTCSTRCPNDIDIAHLMDSLRQLSREAGLVAEPKILKFHKAFLASLRLHGRTFEMGMAARYKLATLDLFSDLAVTVGMFKRGKIGFLPARISGKGRRAVRRMFRTRKGGEE